MFLIMFLVHPSHSNKTVDDCIKQCIPNFCMRHPRVTLEICKEVCGNICIDYENNGMFNVNLNAKDIIDRICSFKGVKCSGY